MLAGGAMLLFRILEKSIKKGTICLQLPDGSERCFGQGEPVARWIFHDESAMKRVAQDPELELGETYMDGGWDAGEGNIPLLLKVLMTNISQERPEGLVRLVELLYRLIQKGNRIAHSYRNVAHHYDIDEWLFRRFLDKEMFYSCAYFETPNSTLEEAQQAKCRLIMDKLVLQPGQQVLDIGSGWGSLAFYLAEHADVHVTGVTLSREQLRVAQDEAQKRGLQKKVTFLLQDYREHQSSYDRIVSVGMFEHVGAKHFREFFNQVDNLLKSDGIALLHTIHCSGVSVETNPWIKRHIFPGGYIPSTSEISKAIEPCSLFSSDIEVLRLHYADTLAHWLERFLEHREEVVSRMGERFARMWEFYLASTEAAFRWWDLNVVHVQMVKRHGIVPVTRNYLCK
jgi:cyclopropane-fatty-acyl-phospholipid synthase